MGMYRIYGGVGMQSGEWVLFLFLLDVIRISINDLS